MTNQTLRCDVCAAPRADGRVLCGQCGADLDTPDAPIVWPSRIEESVEIQRDRRLPRKTVRLLLAGILLAGVIVLAGVLFAGWFTDDNPVMVMPVAQQTTTDETARVVSEIGTVRQGGGEANPHDPKVLLDDDRTDAWFGDAPTLGFVARESLVLRLEEPAWISRIVIANGVHQDPALYDAHGRARSIEILFDGGVTHTATLLDIGRLRQQVAFATPVLTTTIKLTVVAVYPGQAYRDVALSGIDVRGYDVTPAQRVRAEEQAARAPAVDAVG